jgi:hypothetical protein
MSKCISVLVILLFVQFPLPNDRARRGYSNKEVSISGVITKCDCSHDQDHGFMEVRVDSNLLQVVTMWRVTLPIPSASDFAKAGMSLEQLKPGTKVRVTGFAHLRRTHDIYARELVVNRVTIRL